MSEIPLEYKEKVTPATRLTSGGLDHREGVDMTDGTRPCSVDGCGRKHSSRGFCHKHYIAKRYEICDRETLGRRFWAKVDCSGGDAACWPWMAHRGAKGYGQFESKRAHRVAYELAVGSIPPGLQIDHLCRVTSCVNPAHLEPVTNDENMRRAAAALTHCRHGHEYTPENTTRNEQGARVCLTCSRAAGRESYRRKFAPELLGQPPTPRLKTHCPHGHEWTPENTRISVHGRKRQRICRACRKHRDHLRYLARKGAA